MDESDELDDVLARLWPAARRSAQESLDAVIAATERADDETLACAREESHKLVGALGMYGRQESGSLARRLDDLVAGGALRTEDGREEVRAVVIRLRSALDADT